MKRSRRAVLPGRWPWKSPSCSHDACFCLSDTGAGGSKYRRETGGGCDRIVQVHSSVQRRGWRRLRHRCGWLPPDGRRFTSRVVRQTESVNLSACAPLFEAPTTDRRKRRLEWFGEEPVEGGEKFPSADGLGDVIIPAGCEACAAVALHGVRGEDDYGEVACG